MANNFEYKIHVSIDQTGLKDDVRQTLSSMAKEIKNNAFKIELTGDPKDLINQLINLKKEIPSLDLTQGLKFELANVIANDTETGKKILEEFSTCIINSVSEIASSIDVITNSIKNTEEVLDKLIKRKKEITADDGSANVVAAYEKAEKRFNEATTKYSNASQNKTKLAAADEIKQAYQDMVNYAKEAGRELSNEKMPNTIKTWVEDTSKSFKNANGELVTLKDYLQDIKVDSSYKHDLENIELQILENQNKLTQYKKDLENAKNPELRVKGKLSDNFIQDLQSQLNKLQGLEVKVKPVVDEDVKLEVEVAPKINGNNPPTSLPPSSTTPPSTTPIVSSELTANTPEKIIKTYDEILDEIKVVKQEWENTTWDNSVDKQAFEEKYNIIKSYVDRVRGLLSDLDEYNKVNGTSKKSTILNQLEKDIYGQFNKTLNNKDYGYSDEDYGVHNNTGGFALDELKSRLNERIELLKKYEEDYREVSEKIKSDLEKYEDYIAATATSSNGKAKLSKTDYNNIIKKAYEENDLEKAAWYYSQRKSSYGDKAGEVRGLGQDFFDNYDENLKKAQTFVNTFSESKDYRWLTIVSAGVEKITSLVSTYENTITRIEERLKNLGQITSTISSDSNITSKKKDINILDEEVEKLSTHLHELYQKRQEIFDSNDLLGENWYEQAKQFEKDNDLDGLEKRLTLLTNLRDALKNYNDESKKNSFVGQRDDFLNLNMQDMVPVVENLCNLLGITLSNTEEKIASFKEKLNSLTFTDGHVPGGNIIDNYVVAIKQGRMEVDEAIEHIKTSFGALDKTNVGDGIIEKFESLTEEVKKFKAETTDGKTYPPVLTHELNTEKSQEVLNKAKEYKDKLNELLSGDTSNELQKLTIDGISYAKNIELMIHSLDVLINAEQNQINISHDAATAIAEVNEAVSTSPDTSGMDKVEQELHEEADEVSKTEQAFSSLAEKLEYLKSIKSESKFLETAEDKRIDMEEKAWDVGGNRPKSEADSQNKIRQYEELCTHIDTANEALDAFNDKYEKVIITKKNGEKIEIFDAYDLDTLSLAKKSIQDIVFVLTEEATAANGAVEAERNAGAAREQGYKYSSTNNPYKALKKGGLGLTYLNEDEFAERINSESNEYTQDMIQIVESNEKFAADAEVSCAKAETAIRRFFDTIGKQIPELAQWKDMILEAVEQGTYSMTDVDSGLWNWGVEELGDGNQWYVYVNQTKKAAEATVALRYELGQLASLKNKFFSNLGFGNFKDSLFPEDQDKYLAEQQRLIDEVKAGAINYYDAKDQLENMLIQMSSNKSGYDRFLSETTNIDSNSPLYSYKQELLEQIKTGSLHAVDAIDLLKSKLSELQTSSDSSAATVSWVENLEETKAQVQETSEAATRAWIEGLEKIEGKSKETSEALKEAIETSKNSDAGSALELLSSELEKVNEITSSSTTSSMLDSVGTSAQQADEKVDELINDIEMLSNTPAPTDNIFQNTMISSQQAINKLEGLLPESYTGEVRQQIEELYNSLSKVTEDTGFKNWNSQFKVVAENVKVVRNEVDTMAKSMADASAEAQAEAERIGQLIEQENKLTDTQSAKKWNQFSAEQNKYDSSQKNTASNQAQQAFVQRQKKAYEELTEKVNEYIKVKEKIARGEGLDKDIEKVEQLENEWMTLVDTISSKGLFSQSLEDKSLKGIDTLEQRLQQISANTLVSNYKKLEGLYTQKESVINRGYSENSEYIGYLDDEISKLESLNSTLNKVNYTEEQRTKIIEAQESAEIVATKYTEARKIAQDKLAESGKKESQVLEQTRSSLLKQASALLNNGKLMSAYGEQIRAFFQEISNTSTTKERLEEIRIELNKISAEATATGQSGKTMMQMFTQRAKSLVSYLGTFASFYRIVSYIRSAFTTIKDLDTQLVDLRKTTTMTTNELEQFYGVSSDIAKQLGVTTSEIISQAAAWSRLGYSSKEAATEMAQISSKFASISPGMTTENATDYLVSTMQANIYA